jgi:hypothetical protein
MTMNSTLTAAIAATVIILGCVDGSRSFAGTSPSAPSTLSASTEAATPSLATTVPTESFGCGAAQTSVQAGEPKFPLLYIQLDGNDPSQMYTEGSKFIVKFYAEAAAADILAWQIADYAGKIHASGSIAVPVGKTAATLSCSSTLSGYFAVSAKLQKSGATQPGMGSRPSGFAAFGVLPNVADYVPEFGATLDERRIGLMGANYVEPNTGLQPMNENLGSSWVITSRSMSITEPLHAGQYNPSTYQIDPSLKQGTLARVIDLHGLPLWASTAPSADAFGSYPPKSFSAFQSYVALVGEESARIHKDYIPNQNKNYYQPTWEPDPGPATEWQGTDAQMVELYKSVWEGAHSTDPDAAVMGPATQGFNGCAKWLAQFAPLGITKYLDAVSCHGYYTIAASSSKPPEPSNAMGEIQNLRKTMVSLLPAGTKLFVTEVGIGYPMGSHYAWNFPTPEVLEQHAEAVVRTHLINLGEGVDTSFVFYSADFSQHCGFGMFFNLGMAQSMSSPYIEPKPAAMAMAAATRLVDNSRSLGALTNLPAGGYGYAFLLADKSHVMTALWAHNDTFNANESYELEVNAPGTSGNVMLFDSMGNPKSEAYSNGLLKVTLSEMPVYVLSADVAVAKSHARAPEGYSTSF